ncbi:MAG: AAA family ATPase, partial [Deltaproteobacteria bacterium]|nr:AAA family ATPase [Deltaproteobacteria bacterium]
MEKNDSTEPLVVKNDQAVRILRLGATDFADIRQNGDYYADKTKFLYEIAKRSDPFFLARPRRFGKSLLLNTLDCILRGKRELFEGLWIDQSNYKWTPYPVINLNMFSVTDNDLGSMEEKLSGLLEAIAANAGVEIEKENPVSMLNWLITLRYAKVKNKKELIEKNASEQKTDINQTKVAILIDEYDAPIVSHLKDPDKADLFRQYLKRFYATLKSNLDKVGHIFITGVSRFTQLSIFSGLNFVNDITFDRAFAAICGFTAEDLEDLLSDRQEQTIERLIMNDCLTPGSDGNDLRKMIRDWYDGYSWDGNTRVYNPWSVLSCLKKAETDSYWYTTGTPNFLRQVSVEALKDPDWLNKNKIIYKRDTEIDDIKRIPPEVLLLQAGYLTIKEAFRDGSDKRLTLEVPNLEVKAAMWPLAQAMDLVDDKDTAQKWAKKTLDCLLKLDALGVEEAF